MLTYTEWWWPSPGNLELAAIKMYNKDDDNDDEDDDDDVQITMTKVNC